MADLRPLATRFAKRYGVPVGIAHALIQQESGWNPEARNPSGATGLMQIHLPSHPSISVSQALNPRFAINWGLKYLKSNYDKFGSWKLALAAYNAGPGNVENGRWQSFPETRNYVKSILGSAGSIPKGSKSAAPSMAAALPVPLSPPSGAAPDFSQVALQNVTDIASGRFDPIASLTNLTMSVAGQPQPEVGAGIPNFGGLAPQAPKAQSAGDWKRWVGTPERREGPSQPHTPQILQFVGKVGSIAGTKLTPWGNESHSLTTVNGTPSAHGTGHAADIPATDKELVRLGRAALVAAGMPRAKAAKQTGGLFNVNGYQVIFNTDIGGNHYDHVHVGIRGRK